MATTQTFQVSRADGATYRTGLRDYFEYRDLGISDATGGRFGAKVIRARPGTDAAGGAHTHGLEFQMVYVLKGWVEFDYEGEGRVRLGPGDCVLQPASSAGGGSSQGPAGCAGKSMT